MKSSKLLNNINKILYNIFTPLRLIWNFYKNNVINKKTLLFGFIPYMLNPIFLIDLCLKASFIFLFTWNFVWFVDKRVPSQIYDPHNDKINSASNYFALVAVLICVITLIIVFIQIFVKWFCIRIDMLDDELSNISWNLASSIFLPFALINGAQNFKRHILGSETSIGFGRMLELIFR